MTEKPPVLQIRVAGSLACFSRPEFAVERVSYPWITPSAARAVFEAILWKPRIHYQIREIQVLKDIQYCSFRRNEISKKIATTGLGPDSALLTDGDRQQRNTVALRDVAYLIKAELHLNPEVRPSGPDDNHGKYHGMFTRRLDKGQHFHQPYLGMREFAADVRPGDETEKPIGRDLEHGMMFYDFQFPTSPNRHREWPGKGKPRPLLFHARMEQGIVRVPGRAEVLSEVPEGLS